MSSILDLHAATIHPLLESGRGRKFELSACRLATVLSTWPPAPDLMGQDLR